MGILHKKRSTTGEKALAYRGTAFPALGLRVVLYLPILGLRAAGKYGRKWDADRSSYVLESAPPRLPTRLLFRSQKGLTKPRNRMNSTKESPEQFEGAIRSLRSKKGF